MFMDFSSLRAVVGEGDKFWEMVYVDELSTITIVGATVGERQLNAMGIES